jgi:hypothetical protein
MYLIQNKIVFFFIIMAISKKKKERLHRMFYLRFFLNLFFF